MPSERHHETVRRQPTNQVGDGALADLSTGQDVAKRRRERRDSWVGLIAILLVIAYFSRSYFFGGLRTGHVTIQQIESTPFLKARSPRESTGPFIDKPTAKCYQWNSSGNGTAGLRPWTITIDCSGSGEVVRATFVLDFDLNDPVTLESGFFVISSVLDIITDGLGHVPELSELAKEAAKGNGAGTNKYISTSRMGEWSVECVLMPSGISSQAIFSAAHAQ